MGLADFHEQAQELGGARGALEEATPFKGFSLISFDFLREEEEKKKKTKKKKKKNE